MATKFPENYIYDPVPPSTDKRQREEVLKIIPRPPPSTDRRQREEVLKIITIIAVTIIFIIFIIARSVLVYRHDILKPEFHVKSALVSGFNDSSSPAMSLDVEFSIINPNKEKHGDIKYGELVALLSYEDEALSAASIPAFELKSGNNATNTTVKFAVLSTHVSMKGLAFDVKLIGQFHYRGYHDTLFHFRDYSYPLMRNVFCKDVLFEYSSSKSQAFPKKCDLRYHTRREQMMM